MSNRLFLILTGSVFSQTQQGKPSNPICSCYCCPGLTNPYGVDPGCTISSPPWTGDIQIGNAAGCGAVQCYTNFPISCPSPPIRGPRNTSGTIKWGCQTGCRYGLDGTTLANSSTQDVGQITGLDQQFGSSVSLSSRFIYPYLIMIICLLIS